MTKFKKWRINKLERKISKLKNKLEQLDNEYKCNEFDTMDWLYYDNPDIVPYDKRDDVLETYELFEREYFRDEFGKEIN